MAANIVGKAGTGRRSRTVLKVAALAGGAAVLGIAGYAHLAYRGAMAEAERAWQAIAASAKPSDQPFTPDLVADLPEIARRYFHHAIALGTPLRSVVALQMRGTLLLGDKDAHQTYSMAARQILAPPSAFIWLPELGSGPVRITGSDALTADSAWTRFWIQGLVPVVNAKSSPDLVRSAAFRSAMEAIWAPASLLPLNGVGWQQIGPDTARLTFGDSQEPIVIELRLGANGEVRQISGLRWSDANHDKRFQLQPFGGTTKAEATFDGYTIPTIVHAGNFFGTSDYLPFFQAEITAARYL